ncbi:MAG: DUF975 family protein [Treponema sp.]|nr:DUF975 family protein [Treponema sp.]
MFDRKKYKQFARVQLKGRWIIPVLITLIALLFDVLFSLPEILQFPYKDFFTTLASGAVKDAYQIVITASRETQSIPLLNWISIFVTPIIGFATLRIFIKMSQSPEPVTFTDYIKGFNYWIRATLTTLWKELWLFIWLLLVFPFIIVGSIVVTFITLPFAGNEAAFSEQLHTPTLILTFIALVFIFIICVIKSLQYSMTTYIVAEQEKCKITNALKISIKITKGHLWDLFVLRLSFLGWNLLSLITLNISTLWTEPYFKMTIVNTYHALLKEAFEKNLIYVEDFE